MPRKYSRSASNDVEKEMHRFKRGEAKSGKGGRVKNRKQAIAIALSEARKEGKKVPQKSGTKTSGTMSSRAKRSAKSKTSRKGGTAKKK